MAPQTLEASSLVDSLGVNVHLNFGGTAYQDISAVKWALDYLGLRTMRDLGAQAYTTPYDTLASLGYRFDFFAPSGRDQLSVSMLTQRLHDFAVAHPGAIKSLEGPNEVNRWPISFDGIEGLEAARNYHYAFFNAVAADPVLDPLPMINLSLAADQSAAYLPLGDLSGAADIGNVHAYGSYGNQPSVELGALLSYAQPTTTGRPMAITETGYPTLPSNSDQGVDEAAQAKLTLNLVMDAAKLGVTATYLYELFDNPYAGGEVWEHSGLFRGDWTAKPAATALRNLTTILTTNSGQIPVATAPDYTVGNLSGYSASLTVHEAGGAYDIVVWTEPDIWDSAGHQPIEAGVQTAIIVLAQPVSGYLVYDPLISEAPIAIGGPTGEIDVNVTDHPLVVELVGATATYDPSPPPMPLDGGLLAGSSLYSALWGGLGGNWL